MKMRAMIRMALAISAGACGTVANAAALALNNCTTSDMATPGVWNTNFTNSLAYAEANHVPIIMWYGAIGCVHADKGIMTLNQESLTNWFAENKIVMVYKRASNKTISAIQSAKSAKTSIDPDLYNARNWVKEGSSSSGYPIVRIYWNKPDGSNTVSVAFSATNKSMPVKTPAGTAVENLAGQLLGTLKLYLAGYVPGEVTQQASENNGSGETLPSASEGDASSEGTSSTSDTTDSGEAMPEEKEDKLFEFGTKTLKYNGCVFDEEGRLDSVIAATAKKADRNNRILISGKVTTILGKNYTFSARTTKDAHAISLKHSVLGQIDVEFSDNAITGKMDGCEIFSNVEVGGPLPEGTAFFSLEDSLPETNGIYRIVHDALPTNEALTVTKTRMKAGKSGSVKWNSKEKSVVVSETNPSELALTYTSSTGLFKGSFKVYQYKEKKNGIKTLSRISASVSGFVIDGQGVGKAKVKGLDEVDVTIQFDGSSAE